MRLLGSVGQGGRNIAGDVLYVQILLTDWLLLNGKPAIALDGIVGNQTTSAIREFQKANIAVVDGLVEAGRSTIRSLEEKHLAAIKSALVVAPAVRAAREFANSRATSSSPVPAGALFEAYLTRLRG